MSEELINNFVDLICNQNIQKEIEKATPMMEIIKEKVELENKINKAIDMLDLIIPELWNISNAMTYKIKEVKRVLGDKE